MTKPRLRLFAAVLLLVAAAALAPLAAPAARVVAVGDVHGDLKNLQAILREAGIVDEAGHWSGGRTIFVQTGDLVDRGADARAVLDFMMGLERQANEAGGRVFALLGNHEAMNLMGDLRYVTDAGFAAYADEKSEQRREAALRQYAKWRKDHGAPALTPDAESEWLKGHPAGFVEQREAFGPRGRYGRWLRERPVAVKVADTLFVHGGISPAVSVLSPDQINARVEEEIRAFDRAREELQSRDQILPFFTLVETVERATAVAKAVLPGEPPAGATESQALARAGWPAVGALLKYRNWLLVSGDGPLWFRGFVQWSDADGMPQIVGVLQKEGAARVVVGHSTQAEGRIRVRWAGRVFLIDTGLMQGYTPEGRPSALEIDGTQISAIYSDGRMPLATIPPSQAVAPVAAGR